MPPLDELERLVAAHDEQVDRDGLAVWVGAEPTFTDRQSESAQWLCEALGSDKEQRALQLLAALRERYPGAVVLRTVGRQYTGEAVPRWSYGLYARRDGEPIWLGPPDELAPLAATPAGQAELEPLRAALIAALAARGWSAAPVGVASDGSRLVFRCDGRELTADAARDARLARPSIHSRATPARGLRDELGAEGSYLVVLRATRAGVSVELPAFDAVPRFLEFLRALSAACASARVAELCFLGFPPPVDRSVLHCTLTPDPAVLEINQAPAPDLQTFLRWNRELFELAGQAGLGAQRFQYNGIVTDSGGGGQLTIGGPTPEQSPFFVAPQLLPRLVRYLLRHPSLSYWFATQYVGGGSQSPRPDEGLLEQLHELGIALEQLARLESPSPSLLWESLRHFLSDYSGNPHRSELNIEKLYNSHLPGRGCLGLVELRALRMPATPERLTAIAMLFRALVAVLAKSDRVPDLSVWGPALHDRFALPSTLRADLREVFSDLEGAGYGLGAALEAQLLAAEERRIGSLELEGCRLDVEQACEFWPLVGDVVSQESGGSRTVDASTSRIEVRLSTERGAAQLDDWELLANGYRLPLVPLPGEPACRVLGVRFRTFVPRIGLHPSVPAVSRVELHLLHRSQGLAARASVFTWRPDGSAYPGLPRDDADAAWRRAERFVVEHLTAGQAPVALDPPAAALTPFCLDLRRAHPSG
jgi:uncharacterized protein (DUF2126 family)